MSNGMTSLALTGLTTNVNKREAARQELDVYKQMYAMKKAEEAEEQQAAILEQQALDEIRKEADNLLVHDRKLINEKAKGLQASIKQKIKMFGGSRAKFMANGGVAMLGEYKNDLLSSNEMGIYRQNRLNLERILAIQKSGKGHLLSDRDVRSMVDYENNKGGVISFGGMKSDLDMPDQMAYDFGTKINPADILGNKSNYMKALGNYIIDNPEMEDTIMNATPSDQWIMLVRYVDEQYKLMGKARTYDQMYGTRGTRSRTTGKDSSSTPFKGLKLSTIIQAMALNDRPATIENLEESQLSGKEYLDVYASGGYIGQGREMGEGYDADTYSPRKAYAFKDDYFKREMFKYINPEIDIKEGGIITMKPKDIPNLYNAHGEQKSNPFDNKELNLKIDSFILANEVQNEDGSSFIVMDKYKNGEKNNEGLYVTEDGISPTTQPAYYIVYRNADSKTNGGVYYQKVEHASAINQMSFDEHFKNFSDIDDQILSNNIIEGLEKEMTQKAKQSDEIKLAMDRKGAFQDQWNSEAFQRQSYGIDVQGRRSNVMKALYLSAANIAGGENNLQGLIDNNFFTSLIAQKPEIKDVLTNTNFSDKQAMLEILRVMNKDADRETINANTNYIKAALQYLN